MTGSEAVPTLQEFAFLADGERGGLLGPAGDVAWLCFPSWADAPVFGRLVGMPGTYQVTPLGRYTWGGYYEDGSLIRRSRWILTGGAIVECREALALPGTRDRAVLLRRVQGVEGRVRLLARHAPQGCDGEPLPLSERSPEGCWQWQGDGRWLRWSGASSAQPDGEHGAAFEFELGAGEHRDLVLEISTRPFDDPPPPADFLWEETEAGWKRMVPRFDHCASSSEVRLTYAVMRGLTSSSGGMVAACTSSLPERVDSGRRYDYRYVWIRDQSYAGLAAAAAGDERLLDTTIRFIQDRLLEDGAGLRPFYTAGGAPAPDQRTIDVPGYPGSPSLLVGNQATSQFQLDVFGEALLLLSAGARMGILEAEGWAAAERAASAIEQRWQEADAGIWELDRRWWTHSRLICAAGLRAVARCQPRGDLGPRWLALADQLVAETGRRSLHRDGWWQRSPDDPQPDASLLLAGVRGAVAREDPRTPRTLEEIERRLVSRGHCWRFRPDARPLGDAEGAFNLCGFWMVLALLEQGRTQDAVRWFERATATTGTSGLFAEEYDVTQQQLRGNLPQAFVHAGFMECAARIAASA